MGNQCTGKSQQTTDLYNLSSKDKSIESMGMGAVGGGQNTISNEVLDIALGGMASLKQRVSLTFEASNLPNLDRVSKSKTDAICVLFQMNGKQKGGRLGDTEIIADSLDPKWVQGINVDYYFEAQQNFRVEIYDIDDPKALGDLKRQEYIGEFDFTLGKVVSSRNQELEGSLMANQQSLQSRVKIMAQEIKDDFDQTILTFGMECDIQNVSDFVFLVFNKEKAPGRYQPIFKTECKIPKKGKFTYNMTSMGTDTMFGGHDDQPCLVQAFQYKSNGSHIQIGKAEIYLQEIQQQLQNGQTSISSSFNSGSGGNLTLTNAHIQQRVSFLDYIFGGCEIGVHVAIDYTLSNGNPSDPSSLHFMNDSKNQYTDAIQSVCSILQDYDADQMFPVYGFGGKLPSCPDNKASHCFALNGDIYHPEVSGVEGVLEAYKNSLQKVQLYGPTNFANILELVNGNAQYHVQEMSQNNQKYSICLIITDGVITDFDKTVDQIVQGSSLPLSIIIIGVGNADFEQMEQLDGDVEPLYSQNLRKYRDRDIVQFVPFSRLQNDPIRLAKEVLAEVPKQMTDYFIQQRIQPNPKRFQDRAAIQIRNKMKNQIAVMMKTPNDYFMTRRAKMIQQCQEHGMDSQQIHAFLESIGIPEENMMWILQYKDMTDYYNVMKIQ